MLPENISIIAPIIATIGSTISICAHCRPPGSGTSGGASSNNSPVGSSGVGRRIGRRTSMVAIVERPSLAAVRCDLHAPGECAGGGGRKVSRGPMGRALCLPSRENSQRRKEKVMSGEMIKGLTPEMLHHANLTGAHGDAISGGVARMGGVTDMLTGSFGGEAGALNVTGSDAWVQGTNHKSVTAI